MLLKDCIVDTVEYDFISDIFPKNKVTLIHGVYGSGKSYSTIKCLNESGIKPLYVNLDATAGLSGVKHL